MPAFRSPEELESRYVHEVYKDIAHGFRNTRYKAWPCVEQFLKDQPIGSIIADIGCGSGKYLGLSTNSFIMGSDSCANLVEIAHERRHEVSVCNNLKLPYKDGCFDVVISIGVIHHFASTKRRLCALKELGRILRPGGKMLVYVWAMEQNERKFDAQDVLVPYTGSKGKGKKRQAIQQQQSLDISHKWLETNGFSVKRRSRSCDSLLHSSRSNKPFDKEKTRKTTDDIVPSSVEFRALKEIVETIKNKKDQLMTNINSKVMKLYPDKEKHFVNELVSAVVGKIFDRNSCQDEIIENKSQRRLPNIAKFVSSLVNKIFKDKSEDHKEPEETVEVFPDDVMKNDEVLKESEDIFRQSLYESLTTWAKEKMALLSNERRQLPNSITREDSCDSEYSDNNGSPYFLAKINEGKANGSSTSGVKAVSCDNDSDSYSSGDLLNSDSGISDNDTPANTNKTTQISSEQKTTKIKTLQRYYHVFNAKELPDMIEGGVDGVNVLKEFYDHGNWAVVAEKTII